MHCGVGIGLLSHLTELLYSFSPCCCNGEPLEVNIMPLEAQTPCINCGGTQFTRGEKTMALVELNGKGNIQIRGSVLPIIALACNECGALRLFHSDIAK